MSLYRFSTKCHRAAPAKVGEKRLPGAGRALPGGFGRPGGLRGRGVVAKARAPANLKPGHFGLGAITLNQLCTIAQGDAAQSNQTQFLVLIVILDDRPERFPMVNDAGILQQIEGNPRPVQVGNVAVAFVRVNPIKSNTR